MRRKIVLNTMEKPVFDKRTIKIAKLDSPSL